MKEKTDMERIFQLKQTAIIVYAVYDIPCKFFRILPPQTIKTKNKEKIYKANVENLKQKRKTKY